MAKKMFYTLEETAAKLGVSQDQVKQMADDGKLQQFRDRDKLMFKCDQVDELQAMNTTQKVSPGELTLEAEDDIKLSDDVDTRASKTDSIDLMADAPKAKETKESLKSRTATGISVFDADEVEAADPMAQTQVTSGFITDNEDLSLESIGSGSGLLDLTRESDDTSLGAVELLEDVGGGEASDAKMGIATGSLPSSSTGIFDAGTAEMGSASGLVNLEADAGGEQAVYYVEESPDPAGDGLGGGIMLGVFITLVIACIVVVTGMQGQMVALTQFFAIDPASGNPDAGRLGMWVGVLAIVCIVLGAIGLFIGKSRQKTA